MRLLTFLVGDIRYAIASEAVSEVVRAVAVTPLPGAPAVIEGVIDVRGALVPVLDARARFGHEARPIHADDHFILARTIDRVVALHVDRAESLVDVDDAAIEDPGTHRFALQHIGGVAKLADGLVLIHDLEQCLSSPEQTVLATALSREAVDDAAVA